MADEQSSSADEHDDETREESTETHDPTVPQVELTLYQLNVKVSGQATDGLDDVEASAMELMDYLIEQSQSLEDRPDGRGLS